MAPMLEMKWCSVQNSWNRKRVGKQSRSEGVEVVWTRGENGCEV